MKLPNATDVWEAAGGALPMVEVSGLDDSAEFAHPLRRDARAERVVADASLKRAVSLLIRAGYLRPGFLAPWCRAALMLDSTKSAAACSAWPARFVGQDGKVVQRHLRGLRHR